MRTLFIAILLVAAPLVVQAAVLEAQVAQGTEGARVIVLLSATTTPINAIEGTLRLPAGVAGARLYTGESVIQTWIEAPTFSSEGIRFAGIIPGGYVGSAVPGSGFTGAAPLFSFEVTSDPNPLLLLEAAVYQNDGNGTRIAVEDGALMLTPIAGGALQTEDRTPPEFVDAVLVSEPSVAEGRPALLISSYDAESGVDHFEVQEGDGAWAVSGGVYEIQDESGLKSVSVRAYDRSGNFIETQIEGINTKYLKLGYALAGAVLLLLVLALLVYLSKRRARS